MLTLQQALNEPSHSLPSVDAEKMFLNDCKVTEGAGLMRWLNKQEEFDGCLRTMSDLPEVGFIFLFKQMLGVRFPIANEVNRQGCVVQYNWLL